MHTHHLSLSLRRHTARRLQGGPASKLFHALIFTGRREQEAEKNNSSRWGPLSRTGALVCSNEDRMLGLGGLALSLRDVAYGA